MSNVSKPTGARTEATAGSSARVDTTARTRGAVRVPKAKVASSTPLETVRTSVRTIHQAKFTSSEEYLTTVISKEIEKPIREEANFAKLFIKEPEKIITTEEANRSKLRFQLKKLLQNCINTGIPFLKSIKPGSEHLYTNENRIIGHVRQRTGKIINAQPAHKRLQQLNHLLAQLNYLLYPNLETDLDLLQLTIDANGDAYRVKPELDDLELVVVDHTPGQATKVNPTPTDDRANAEADPEQAQALIKKYSLYINQLLAKIFRFDDGPNSWSEEYQNEINVSLEELLKANHKSCKSFLDLFEGLTDKSIVSELRPRLLALALRELVLEEISIEQSKWVKKAAHITKTATIKQLNRALEWAKENPSSAVFRAAVAAILIALASDRVTRTDNSNNEPNTPKVHPSTPSSPIERKAPVFDHKALINSTLNELKTQSIVIWDPNLQATDNTASGANKDPQVNKARSIAQVVYNLLYLPDGNTYCVGKLRVVPGDGFKIKQQTTATPAGTNTSLLTIELGDIYLKSKAKDQELQAKIYDELRSLARIKSGQAYPLVKGATAQGTTTMFTYPTSKPSSEQVTEEFNRIVLGLKK